MSDSQTETNYQTLLKKYGEAKLEITKKEQPDYQGSADDFADALDGRAREAFSTVLKGILAGDEPEPPSLETIVALIAESQIHENYNILDNFKRITGAEENASLFETDDEKRLLLKGLIQSLGYDFRDDYYGFLASYEGSEYGDDVDEDIFIRYIQRENSLKKWKPCGI